MRFQLLPYNSSPVSGLYAWKAPEVPTSAFCRILDASIHRCAIVLVLFELFPALLENPRPSVSHQGRAPELLSIKSQRKEQTSLLRLGFKGKSRIYTDFTMIY